MFFKKRELSRFNQYEILLPLQLVIQDLHKQQRILKKAAALKRQPFSLDVLKYELVTNILHNIDEVIHIFNNAKRLHQTNEFIYKEIGALLIDISITVNQLQIEDYALLNQHRNSQRSITNKCLNYGLIGAGVTIGTCLSGPIAGATLACGTGMIGYVLRSAIGLNNPVTRSAQLIYQLIQETETALNTIFNYFGQNRQDFEIQFLDKGQPCCPTMQENIIYLYLLNGSVVYSLKKQSRIFQDVHLDKYLDINTLLSDKKFKYENIDALIFENYLEEPALCKPNDLEIEFVALTQKQIILIYGAVYKSLLYSYEELKNEESQAHCL